MPCRWCNDTGKDCGCGGDHCAHCGGTGHVTPPPFGDGSTAKISQEKVSYIAKAATDMRCIGDPGMIRGTAYIAAKIYLPYPEVLKFQEYWGQPYRDANLGEFIRQIAELAEQMAELPAPAENAKQ